MAIDWSANSGTRLFPALSRLETDRAKEHLIQCIDWAIVAGAQLRAPKIIHFLRLALDEIEHLHTPSLGASDQNQDM